MTFIPQIGNLYSFREDNISELCKKYNYYYTGLLLCIQADILNDPSFDEISGFGENPIYGFDVYNCIQHFANSDIFAPEGIKISNVLYLSLSEVNDMLVHANQN